MANGREKEKQLVEALRAFFVVETNELWDKNHCVDAVVVRPIGSLLIRAPLAIQITWRPSWNKRGSTFEAATAIADRLVMVEIDSQDVDDLVIFGLATALNQLFMDGQSPRHALVEISQSGRYKLCDFEVRLQAFKTSLENIIHGEIQGRLTFWNSSENYGFIDAMVDGGLITFFCGTRESASEIVEKFSDFSGQIPENRQPLVVFTDGGLNKKADYRKKAVGVRLATRSL